MGLSQDTVMKLAQHGELDMKGQKVGGKKLQSLYDRLAKPRIVIHPESFHRYSRNGVSYEELVLSSKDSRQHLMEKIKRYFLLIKDTSYLGISYDGPKQIRQRARDFEYLDTSTLKGVIVVPNPFALSPQALEEFIKMFKDLLELYSGRDIRFKIFSSKEQLYGKDWQMLAIRTPYHRELLQYLRSVNVKIHVPYDEINIEKKNEVADVLLCLDPKYQSEKKHATQTLFETVAEYIYNSAKATK